MQVTCLVLVLPRVVARGGAEKGAGKGRHKLRGLRRVGTENSENMGFCWSYTFIILAGWEYRK